MNFREGSPQSPFSISSSFILFFVLLPFFLNTNKQLSKQDTKSLWCHQLFECTWSFLQRKHETLLSRIIGGGLFFTNAHNDHAGKSSNWRNEPNWCSAGPLGDRCQGRVWESRQVITRDSIRHKQLIFHCSILSIQEMKAICTKIRCPTRNHWNMKCMADGILTREDWDVAAPISASTRAGCQQTKIELFKC